MALKLNEVYRLTGLSSQDMSQRIARDARFLTVPYGTLVARVRFLSELLGQQGIQRINLSSLACMPLNRFGSLYPEYEAFLTSKVEAVEVEEGKTGRWIARKPRIVGEGREGETIKKIKEYDNNNDNYIGNYSSSSGSSSNNNNRRRESGIGALEKQYGSLLWRQCGT